MKISASVQQLADRAASDVSVGPTGRPERFGDLFAIPGWSDRWTDLLHACVDTDAPFSDRSRARLLRRLDAILPDAPFVRDLHSEIENAVHGNAEAAYVLGVSVGRQIERTHVAAVCTIPITASSE